MDMLRKFSWVLGLLGGWGVLVYLGYRTFVSEPSPAFNAVGIVGMLLLVAFLFLDKDEVGGFFSARSTARGFASVILICLGAILVFAVNKLSKDHNTEWDWTSTGAHTLSEQTVQLVTGLDEPVEIVAFFQTGQPEEKAFKGMIDRLSQFSDKLSIEVMDPNLNPRAASTYGNVSAYGTVILKQGEREQRMENDFGEEAFANALVNLTSRADHTICFTTGHAEGGVDDDMTETGMGGLVLKLESANNVVEELELYRQVTVPERCEVVVIAGPRIDPLPQEREMLARYVARGGTLMVLLEPLSTPQLAADLKRYGVAVGDDIVLENNPELLFAGGDVSMLMFNEDSFDHHPITKDLKMGMMVLARSVRKTGVPGIDVQELITTSDQAYGETDLLSGAEPTVDPDTELVGKIPVMVVAEVVDPEAMEIGPTFTPAKKLPLPDAPPPEEEAEEGAEDAPAEAPEVPEEAPEEAPAEPVVEASPLPEGYTRKPGGRVVVFGDSDFANNSGIMIGNNMDLFLNSVAWVVGEEDQISIRANEAKAGTLTMNLVQTFLVWMLALFVIPPLCLLGAFATWMYRRRL